ncbi:hypothetical protein [Acidovorax sp.]
MINCTATSPAGVTAVPTLSEWAMLLQLVACWQALA